MVKYVHPGSLHNREHWQLIFFYYFGFTILHTCVVVARYFLSSLVLIRLGFDKPGQSIVICLIAVHPSWGEPLVRAKTNLFCGSTPAFILVERMWLIPSVITHVFCQQYEYFPYSSCALTELPASPSCKNIVCQSVIRICPRLLSFSFISQYSTIMLKLATWYHWILL